ncbi:transport and Golgi organization protein 1 homolog isoform X2 [Tamandua tetradactyla]|uniref:transport and Golgi organization protein 1 homolog isoform X2 n=1 Tax=Tamandua tetradactyla TaxID=48850 RepID=UPI00405492BA
MGSLGLLFWLLLVQSSWWMLGHPNAKLERKECKKWEYERQPLAAKEKANADMQAVQKYKRSLEEMEPTVRQSESSFRHQIILHEEKAHDNWLRARALLREMFVKDTKSHELRQSLLEETEKNNFLEECRIWKPMPGRYDMQKSPRRGPGAAPLWNGSSGRPVLTKAMDEGKVNTAARGPLLSQDHPSWPTL